MGILRDKVAIITGASSGIGRATAILFACEGASVILNARNKKGLADTEYIINRQGGTVITVPGDICLEKTHQTLIAQAKANFGKLDIAVNNAGTLGPIKRIADIDSHEWHEIITTNLTSAYLAAHHQIQLMSEQKSGSLIFTSSFVGSSVGLPGMTAYGASKAGLMGLVKGITADYAHDGIRANVLIPGGTKTPMSGDKEQQKWAASLHTMKRIAEPNEIAQAALFLASPMASFVTGSALYADGGNSAVK